MIRRNVCSMAAVVLAFGAATAYADVVNIDFENVSQFTTANGYRTKVHTLSLVDGATAGSKGITFTWVTDGSYAGQYAYLCKDLGKDMDFSAAEMSFAHIRTNRSNVVGLSLWDDGNLVASWEWPISTSWIVRSASVLSNPATSTGIGDIKSVDEIRFMHKNTSNPGSGRAHTVTFDSFVAANVVPEPATMTLLTTGLAGILVRKK